MSKTAALFPGQGAQYVGMGKDLYEASSVAKEIFLYADDILGRPLSSLMFFGAQEELSLTKNSQVAIYVMSFAVYKAFCHAYPQWQPDICAGLSLGEYTALAAAGKCSFEEGLKLVEKRALLMQQACERVPGSMRVVLGLSEEVIAQVLQEIQGIVCIANMNCPGQIVIAGELDSLSQAEVALKKKGAKRVLPLDVSGAFHSPLMQSARDALTPAILQMHLYETSIHVVMNSVGDFVHKLHDIRQNLIRQVTDPVYWQKGIENMEQSGVSQFIEFGCGKTLQGMNKRIGVSATTQSIETLEEIAHGIA